MAFRVPGGVRDLSHPRGCLWLPINVIIDLPHMLTGPIDMTLSEYFADIGLTYVIIPLVMIGLGFSAQRARVQGSGEPSGQ